MQPRQMIQRLMNNISTVIVGKQEVIEYALIALLCRRILQFGRARVGQGMGRGISL